MSRRRATASLAQILDAGGLPYRVASCLPGPGLLDAWSQVVRGDLAPRAHPVCLQEDGTLVVAVRGSVWRQEMELLAPEIMAVLQERGQPVAALHLVKARTEAEPAPAPPPSLPLTPEQEEAVAACVAGVRDPELRQSLASLLQAQLRARQP